MTANNPRTRKAKGMILQKYIVERLLSYFPELTTNDIRSVPSSVPGNDIWLSEKAKRRIPLNIEAKNQEKFNIWQAIEQVESRANKHDLPIVIFKRNRTRPYVCIELENFLQLLERYTR